MKNPRQRPVLWKHNFNTPRANEGGRHRLDFSGHSRSWIWVRWLLTADSGEILLKGWQLLNTIEPSRTRTIGVRWSIDLLGVRIRKYAWDISVSLGYMKTASSEREIMTYIL